MPGSMELSERASCIKTCPAEIIHLICRFLSPEDIKEARLVCKSLSVIASQYLVDTVTFNSSSDSLTRLKNISQHSLFSQHVVKLIYEANLLPPIHNVTCYENILISKRMHSRDHPEPPPSDASPREFRVFMRALKKFSTDCGLSKRQLETQFNKYKTLRDEQQALLEQKEDKRILLDALPRFPRLRHIRFDNLGRCTHVLSERYCEQFQDVDCFPPPGHPSNPKVVPQVAHLLQAMCKSKAPLKSFDMAAVSPDMFKSLAPSTRRLILRKLNGLKDVKLGFKVDEDIEELLHELEPEESFEVLEDGSWREFLASNQGLEDVQISFLDCPMHIAVKIENLFGNYYWPKLNSVCLMSIKSSADDFLACLRRHSSTLTIIRLGFIVLTEGEWVDTIDTMQEIFHEKDDISVKFWGYLLNNNPTDCIDLSYVDLSDFDDDEGEGEYGLEPVTLAQAIDDYICYEEPGDDFSLNPLLRLDDFHNPSEYDIESENEIPGPWSHHFYYDH